MVSRVLETSAVKRPASGDDRVVHQLFGAQHGLGLAKVVGQLGGILLGLLPVQPFQRLSDAGVEPDTTGYGKLARERFLHQGVCELVVADLTC